MSAETDRAILQAALDLANAQSEVLREALRECITEQGAHAFYSLGPAMRRLLAINEIVRKAIEP